MPGFPRRRRREKCQLQSAQAFPPRGTHIATLREKWQNGGEFRSRFPEEKEYRHSLPEETEALLAAVGVLERLDADKSTANLVEGDTGLVLLLKLHRADLIEPFVLFSLSDPGVARDYIPWRVLHRGRLEEYLDKFVVPSVPMV